MRDYALPVRLLSPFDRQRLPATPTVELGEPTVALAVSQLALGREGIRFTLHLALGFEAEFFHAFKHIDRAVVLTIEEPDSRRFAALRLIDETLQYLEPTWPNFHGYDWAAEPSIVFSGLTRNIVVEVDTQPSLTHEGLWLQASVLCHRSNRVHLPLARAADQPS
jgi:hypothetical protein